MKGKILILNIILGILRPFAYMQRVKSNRILFISLENDKLEGNFKLIADSLDRSKYDVKFNLVKFNKNLSGYAKYFFNCIKQLFLVNSSALIMIDFNNYICANYKRPEVKVFELWHASGCIKKFGNETDRDYKVKNYDYVLSAADAFKPFFAKAFNVKEDDVMSLGIPITDAFFDENRKNNAINRLNMTYPIKGKKVILYAPTFRGRLMKGFKGEYLDVDSVSTALGDDYIILYKMHPLMKDYVLLDKNNKNVVNVSHEDLTDLFFVTDILISDYSALIFDFSVFDKPIVLFAPDIEEYRSDTGLFLDYENEMPGPIVKTKDELISVLEGYEFDEIKRQKISDFKEKYAAKTDGNSLKRVVTFIDSIMKG